MPNTPSTPSRGAPTGAQIIAEGMTRLGDPYVYGATGPNRFDCSGLTQWLYAHFGLKIPRTAESQFQFGKAISREQLAQGDLVFSAGSDGTTSHPGHVGIYAGVQDGVPMVLEAPHTGANVRLTPLSQFDPSGYRRMPGLATATDAGLDIPGLGAVAGGLGDVAGGLLSVPKDVVQFFSTATDDLVSTGRFFWAFTQPSTWVRIGAGYLGSLFLVAGIAFLIMSGVTSS